MKNLSDYRQAGRTDLSGRWAESAMLSFVACVAFSLVGGGGSILLSMWPFVSGLGNLFVLLLLPMSWGYNMAFLANHRRVSNDPFDITCLVEGYHDFWRIFSTYFLIVLYIFLWSLLLVIPGIIKSLSYSMTPYILKDRPDALHTFIFADMPFRADRIVRLYGESDKSPEARLNEKDKRRRVNYQHYTGRTWGQAQNYDICLDTGVLGIDQCADIIVGVVENSRK